MERLRTVFTLLTVVWREEKEKVGRANVHVSPSDIKTTVKNQFPGETEVANEQESAEFLETTELTLASKQHVWSSYKAA